MNELKPSPRPTLYDLKYAESLASQTAASGVAKRSDMSQTDSEVNGLATTLSTLGDTTSPP